MCLYLKWLSNLFGYSENRHTLLLLDKEFFESLLSASQTYKPYYNVNP